MSQPHTWQARRVTLKVTHSDKINGNNGQESEWAVGEGGLADGSTAPSSFALTPPSPMTHIVS